MAEQQSDVPRDQEGGLRRIPFTPAQEAGIRSLASWMAATGWIHIALSAFDGFNLIATRNHGAVFNALIKILVGIWCLQGAKAFRTVATTDEADQAHVAIAFARLRAIFLLQAIVVIVGLVIVCAAALAVMVAGAGHQLQVS